MGSFSRKNNLSQNQSDQHLFLLKYDGAQIDLILIRLEEDCRYLMDKKYKNWLAKHLSDECNSKNIPCFGILGDLIISFSKLLDQKALNVPSRQHIMDDEYYLSLIHISEPTRLLSIG